MTDTKLICIRKLSVFMPAASRAEVSCRLEALRQMIAHSSQLADSMAHVIGILHQEGMKRLYLSDKLKENEQYIKTIFDKCSDLVVREFKITGNPASSALAVYLDGMAKQELVEAVLEKLTGGEADSAVYSPRDEKTIQYLLGIRHEDIYKELNSVVEALLDGKLVFADRWRQ